MTRRTRFGGWVAMAAVVVVALTIGIVQGREPRTLQDRVDAIARTIKCPQCRSESVYESRAAASEDIRRQIAVQVQDGRSADEIRASISAAYDQDLVLTPPSSGVGGLVWVLPIVALTLALGGLVLAFRRWRAMGESAEPSEDDRALVAQARAAQEGDG
jgi:cytochrome c-type biogenesis protein CcmH